MKPAARTSLRHSARVLHQAAAHCLVYPDDETWHARIPLLRAALAHAPDPAGAPLHAFLDHAAAHPAADLALHYVDVFDFKDRHSLYLTWWTDGDTRRRGASLVAFKTAYQEHGLDYTDEELPDFLPAVLEFTAATGSAELLTAHRAGLELLRIALTEAGTPYARVLDAVCATLPGPSPKDRAEARALAAAGPARETVGLDGLPPYAHLGLLPVVTGDR
ncbi:nitrate reductase molybdenum cofactor assembly chaperone [Yinghuangia seranimata]|uniref:nitrate reductase molybdenum cofactor assembly chaperone n=1 Tax=Yinghuangia seranimata TaxID=408067 RepID=UPI00248BCC8D|nr:nitrate reductase molybdenum cofactor assembly chaperone [Yinghuangia seranimata]MDI2127884.1 nitrate reductase molybdenum cofactor assembly chaperone [Yinghuangia seranimata]